MLVALLSVGVLLAAPVFYLFAEWTRLSRAERSQVRELVEQARALPNDPARFTREQALAAQRIISRAHELPSLLPSDIRELRPLWEARRDIRERAQQHRDSAVPGEQGIDAVARVWARAFYSHIERGESLTGALGAAKAGLLAAAEHFEAHGKPLGSAFESWPGWESTRAAIEEAEGISPRSESLGIVREIARQLAAGGPSHAQKREEPWQRRVARGETLRPAGARA